MSRASIGEYVVTSKLGSGSFAVVYKGYHKTSKVPVAIKALSLNKLNGKLLTNLEMEIAIMRQIDHPNVVKLYDIKKTEKHMYLILEYCAGGDLQQYMRRRQQGTNLASQLLSEDVARHFLRELAKGMQCLWQHNLIHRDLKPQNLLLVEDSPTSALKIADFGFARHLATTSLAETLCGSPLYMAPEILKFQKYDAKADLWSVGTILFEMLAGRPPYGGANHVQLLANIERQPLRFPPTLQLSRSCRHLLVALLQRKPALRLGFAEFFADPFVDLQPLPEHNGEAEVARRSSTTASIREEEEEDQQELAGNWGVSTTSSNKSKSGTEDAAIAPIADQLWTISAAGTASLDSGNGNTDNPVQEDWPNQPQTSSEALSLLTSEGKTSTGMHFSSVFSMSSSLASSVGPDNTLGGEDNGEDEDDEDDNSTAERQYVCAAEALALYVKCLRLVQHVVLNLRQDIALGQSRGSMGSSSGSSPPRFSETNRKVSMAFLTEQLTHFLDRAEQCKSRMARLAHRRTTSRSVASHGELLYAHALRLGRQGAIREVLGHTHAAHDHYLQALLLLESLLMETPDANGVLAVDDQKNVNVFLISLEQRLKNVRVLLRDEQSSDTSASYRQRMQHPPRTNDDLRSTTAAVL
ncbi:Serine/threonine-protein kinase ulk2 [Phytophthora boehmeriae]|uniref:Serine/threonine-protein kinase ulk2 n=1 Tax=Phytophthora boehmeriae TaxID=109152 RepID=A0A8T1VCC8_9STRA|nr:Serine/threonine-protein kinase ulk2 [Phytophthora boehmeriae]